MNQIYILWRKRIKYLTTLYYKFIQYQVDWVILIYSIALLALMIYAYYPSVKDIPEIFAKENHATILAFVSTLFLVMGKQKPYFKMADEVFLTPLNLFGRQFITYSAKLSIGLSLFSWSVYSLVIYGFLRNKAFIDFYSFLYFLLIGLAFKLLYININYIVYHRRLKSESEYTRLVSLVAAAAVAFILLTKFFIMEELRLEYIAILPILLILAMLSFKFKQQINIKWSRWINDDINNRARNLNFLLGNPATERTSSRSTSSPQLSGRKYEPFNGRGALLLLYSRTLLRGKGNLKLFASTFLLIGAINYFVSESLVKAIVNVLFIFLVGDFLTSIWHNFKDDVWIRVYPFSASDKYWAIQRGPLYAIVPLSALVAIIHLLFSATVLHPIIDVSLLVAWGMLVVFIRTSILSMKFKL